MGFDEDLKQATEEAAREFEADIAAEVSAAVLAQIREDTARGLLADGRNVAPIDLRDTGRLMAGAQSDARGVRFPAPYAQHVNKRYPYAGIAPQSRAALESKIAEITARKTGGR